MRSLTRWEKFIELSVGDMEGALLAGIMLPGIGIFGFVAGVLLIFREPWSWITSFLSFLLLIAVCIWVTLLGVWIFKDALKAISTWQKCALCGTMQKSAGPFPCGSCGAVEKQ